MPRYLLPGLLVALPLIQFAAWNFEPQNVQGYGFLACLAAWPIGSIWWVILAIRDRRPYLARLMLIWIPATVPIGVFAFAMQAFAKDDSVGIALAPMIWGGLAIGAAFVVASIICSLYRLGDATRSPQP